MTDQAWGDDTVRWAPAAHYDAGFTAMQAGDSPTALAHAALGLLLLEIEKASGFP